MSIEDIAKTIIAIVTSSGFAYVVTTLRSVIRRVQAGQKLREPARREQIVEARDAAAAREAAERARADAAERALDLEQASRRTWQEYAYEVRRYCINHGTPLADLPPLPTATV